jgi:hypothetical protein
MTEYLQYGALGVLALVLVGIFVLAKMFMKSFIKNFTDLIQSVREIPVAMKELSGHVREQNKNLTEQKKSMDILSETIRKKFRNGQAA